MHLKKNRSKRAAVPIPEADTNAWTSDQIHFLQQLELLGCKVLSQKMTKQGPTALLVLPDKNRSFASKGSEQTEPTASATEAKLQERIDYLETELKQENLPESVFSAIPEIHRAVLVHCPEAEHLAGRKKQVVADLISECLWGSQTVTAYLAELTNQDVVDFLLGTAELAKKHTGGSIPRLMTHLAQQANDWRQQL